MMNALLTSNGLRSSGCWKSRELKPPLFGFPILLEIHAESGWATDNRERGAGTGKGLSIPGIVIQLIAQIHGARVETDTKHAHKRPVIGGGDIAGGNVSAPDGFNRFIEIERCSQRSGE